MSEPTTEPQPAAESEPIPASVPSPTSAEPTSESTATPISNPNRGPNPNPRPPQSPRQGPREDRDPNARPPRPRPPRDDRQRGDRDRDRDRERDRPRPQVEAGPSAAEGTAAPAEPKAMFRNPYNFVPAPPRSLDHPDLGDQPYPGLDRWHDDRYSGSIRVRMTVNTPLLLPDAGQARVDGGRASYPTRTDSDGKPELAASSLKGMLRAAYEAIANSRFGVFAGEDRLTYRMPADGRIRLQPARVERNKAGKLELRMLTPLKLKCYDAVDESKAIADRPIEPDRGRERVGLRYDDQTLPAHGDKVWVQADAAGRVAAIVKFHPAKRPKGMQWRLGWVCITGPNAPGKVNERVFIRTPNFEDELIPADELKASWDAVTQGYRDALAERFDEGLLCFAERDRRNGRVLNLMPVMISRKPFDLAPRDLLTAGHRPASSLAELSPADRVFGWADASAPDGPGCKGLVRVRGIECRTPKEQAIQALKPPLPLASLGAPKPQQARFYVKSGNSGARPDYQHGQRLRGRKVYPHHANLAADYWRKPGEDRTQTLDEAGRRQEYRRPGDPSQDERARLMESWVAKGTEFAFTIEVSNLSKFELGALLWLLEMPARRFHRLGYAKPLGFGSVRLDWIGGETKISMGDQIRAWHGSLTAAEPARAPGSELKEAIEHFKAEIAAVARKPFEEAPQIAAFVRASGGFDDKLPIHYPRTTEAPDPQRPSHDWFAKNSLRRQPFNLPDLVEDAGLPIDPS